MRLQYLLLNFFLVRVESTNLEKDLLNHLFEDYNKNVRPVLSVTDTLNVSVGISLQQVLGLDTDKMTLTTSLWVNLEWIDHSLSWEKTGKYGEIEDFRVSPEDIWTPNIEFYNGHEKRLSAGESDQRVVVRRRGLVSWIPPYVVTVACQADTSYFPFDEQICHLKMGSWVYHGDNIHLISKGLDITTYVINHEWTLLNTSSKMNKVYYECCVEPYEDIDFTIHLKRKSENWVHFITRSYLLTLISFLSGMIPLSDPTPRLAVQISIILLTAVTGPPSHPQNSLLATITSQNLHLQIMTVIQTIGVICLQLWCVSLSDRFIKIVDHGSLGVLFLMFLILACVNML